MKHTKLKSVLINLLIITPLFIGGSFLLPGFLQSPASAITCPNGDTLPDAQADQCPSADGNTAQDSIGQGDARLGQETDDCETSREDPELTRGNCKIIDYLVIGINFLSAVAGMAMVFSFIFAGYQYITARDNPQSVQAAKNRILWTLIALFAFLFMYGILNWLVPGGVLP